MGSTSSVNRQQESDGAVSGFRTHHLSLTMRVLGQLSFHGGIRETVCTLGSDSSLGLPFVWCRQQDLNPQPWTYDAPALPIELCRQKLVPEERFERSTPRLQSGCSTTELHRHMRSDRNYFGFRDALGSLRTRPAQHSYGCTRFSLGKAGILYSISAHRPNATRTISRSPDRQQSGLVY
jgi:hypothetical protein